MLSVVIPCYNEQDGLRLTYETLIAESATWFEPLEIVLVDDGSEDSTWSVIEGLVDQDSRVRGVRLTRNFGQQAAIGAGLEQTRGDAVVILDADLQDPPGLIGEMLARWQEGADIVYAKRTCRRGESLGKRIAGHCFYRILDRCTDVPIPRDAGDFCLLDARVVGTLRRFREQGPFWRGLRAWTGYKHAVVHFERPGRACGQSNYTLRKLFELAGNGLFSFSRLPMRLPLYAGGFALLSSLLLTLAVIVHRLAIPGETAWPITPTALALFYLGAVQLLSIGVIGECLNRIYDEVRGRPRWLVERTISSGSHPNSAEPQGSSGRLASPV